MIAIESKRRKRENILKKYPNAVIADVTSQATDGLVRLSPFYPHGGIPVPFSEGYTAMCVCLTSSTTKARAPQLLQLGRLMMKNVDGQRMAIVLFFTIILPASSAARTHQKKKGSVAACSILIMHPDKQYFVSSTKEVTISFHSLSQPLTSRTSFPYTIYSTEFGDKAKIIQPTSGLQYKSIQLFLGQYGVFCKLSRRQGIKSL